MNNLFRYSVRLIAAFITFLVTGFISLLILKVSFGNPYNLETATNVGYILLLIILLCVLYVDTIIDQKLIEKISHV